MGDHKDLTNEFAVDKIKDLAENIKTCMFCTYNEYRIQITITSNVCSEN